MSLTRTDLSTTTTITLSQRFFPTTDQKTIWKKWEIWIRKYLARFCLSIPCTHSHLFRVKFPYTWKTPDLSWIVRNLHLVIWLDDRYRSEDFRFLLGCGTSTVVSSGKNNTKDKTRNGLRRVIGINLRGCLWKISSWKIGCEWNSHIRRNTYKL